MSLRRSPLVAFLLGLCLLGMGSLAAVPTHAQSTTPTYSIDVRDQPLRQAIETVAQTTDLRIVYAPDLVAGKTATCSAVDVPIDALLDCVLRGTDLRARKMATGAYTLEPIPDASGDDTTSSSSERHTISGFVRDATTGEALIGATVYVPSRSIGTATNAYGFFSLTLPSDSATVVFSYVGYTSETRRLTDATPPRMQVTLAPATMQMDGVEVVGARTRAREGITRLSTRRIATEQIQRMPALLGEVDVLRAMQHQPGVATGSEGQAGMYVRGGTPDQNLILLDGAPVYNAFHAFGFLSVFNADAIRNVELTTGGFPARYGGRLSSVLELRTKEGNRNAYAGSASLGLVSTQGALEGPMGDRGSFFVTARRSLAGEVAQLLDDQRPDASFYDLNAKVNVDVSDRDHLYLSLYGGQDRLGGTNRIAGRDDSQTVERYDIEWGNTLSTLRWTRLFSDRLFASAMLLYSDYDYGTADAYTREDDGRAVEEYSLHYDAGIRDVGAALDVDVAPSPRHSIRLGGTLTRHEYRPGLRQYVQNSEQTRADTTLAANPTVYTTEWAAYVEDEMQVSDRLAMNLGVRTSGYAVSGEHVLSVLPRLSARYRLTDRHSVLASYAGTTQYVHQLSNSGLGLPTDLWVPSTPRTEPEQAHQITAGWTYDPHDDWAVRVEGYAKWMDHLIEYREGASYVLNENWESLVTSGRGHSRGVEVLLERTEGRLTGSLAYTLSRTTRTFDDLNNGETFPFRYDRRHDLSLAVQYTLSRRWAFASTWVYRTGSALTLPVSWTRFDNQDTVGGQTFGNFVSMQLGDRNGARMPAYHRLDVSATYTLDQTWGSHQIRMGAYNAYNRQNPYFLHVEYDAPSGDIGNVRLDQSSLMPIVPSVAYTVTF